MGKKKLILAGIVSAGVLGTAVVTNLPSIFAEASEETTQAAETTQSDAGAQKTNPTAEEKLAQKLNIQPSEIVAIGDAANDIEMLEYAGLAIAMGNASEEVKAIADIVTDTNENNGVIKAIDNLFQ